MSKRRGVEKAPTSSPPGPIDSSAHDDAAEEHLFQNVKSQVSRAISDGRYPIGKMLPGVPELARRFNCSSGTIRRALTELAGRGIVQRIRSKGTIVRAHPPMGRVCLLLSRDNHTNLLLQDKVYAALADAGFGVEMVPGAISPDALAARVKQIRQHPEPTDFLVWFDAGPHSALDVATDLFPKRVLYSFGGALSTRRGADVVVMPDLRRMSRLVVQHLLGLGHRRIAINGGFPLDPRESWGRATAEYARDLIEVAGGQYFPYFLGEDEDAQLRRLTSDEKVTAMWALNDHEATKCEVCCSRFGLRVPEDLSIVGRWDTPWSESAPTTLTSISLDPEATGVAIAAAVRALATGESIPTEPIQVAPKLVQRNSTAAAMNGNQHLSASLATRGASAGEPSSRRKRRG